MLGIGIRSVRILTTAVTIAMVAGTAGSTGVHTALAAPDETEFAYCLGLTGTSGNFGVSLEPLDETGPYNWLDEWSPGSSQATCAQFSAETAQPQDDPTVQLSQNTTVNWDAGGQPYVVAIGEETPCDGLMEGLLSFVIPAEGTWLGQYELAWDTVSPNLIGGGVGWLSVTAATESTESGVGAGAGVLGQLGETGLDDGDSPFPGGFESLAGRGVPCVTESVSAMGFQTAAFGLHVVQTNPGGSA